MSMNLVDELLLHPIQLCMTESIPASRLSGAGDYQECIFFRKQKTIVLMTLKFSQKLNFRGRRRVGVLLESGHVHRMGVNMLLAESGESNCFVGGFPKGSLGSCDRNDLVVRMREGEVRCVRRGMLTHHTHWPTDLHLPPVLLRLISSLRGVSGETLRGTRNPISWTQTAVFILIFCPLFSWHFLRNPTLWFL